MNVKIITDSASDLPNGFAEEYQVDVLPLAVIANDGEYKDGIEISPAEVFTRMRKGEVLKTSQITTNEYYKKFEKYVQEGRECIYIAFSSELSGSYQASIMARNQIIEKYGEEKCKIHIIDSKCASLGFGLVVMETAKEALKGTSCEELIEFTKRNAAKMDHLVSVFNLTYLYRGGRLKKSSAIIGNLLNVYPIIEMREGRLEVLETVRGRKKNLKRILELMKERGANLKDQTIGIVHGDDEEAIEELKSAIRDNFGTTDFISRPVGAVIGAHTGPEFFAIFYYKK